MRRGTLIRTLATVRPARLRCRLLCDGRVFWGKPLSTKTFVDPRMMECVSSVYSSTEAIAGVKA